MSLVKWPIIQEDDLQAVINVLRDGRLVKGDSIVRLQTDFATYIGVSYCLAISSCTHAIHLALRALGIGPGDEVLVPNLTYCGSVSPIVNAGATPVFVDVNASDFNINCEDAVAKRSKRTKAIIPVHLHGYPCDIALVKSALPGLLVIEDVCQAPGAKRGIEFAGAWGDIACFSLNQVKPLWGGQGGLIVTSNHDTWCKIKNLASPGCGDTVGLSYEITEIAAALAANQLSKLESILAKATDNYETFKSVFHTEYFHVQPCEPDVRPTWHKLRLRVHTSELDDVLRWMKEQDIPYETWPGTLVSRRTEYGKYSATSPVADAIMHSSFILGNEQFPFHAQDRTTVIDWATQLVGFASRRNRE